jgi:ElaB/YqjD/DUF883 family membrane-anchored ribosome-binding protein
MSSNYQQGKDTVENVKDKADDLGSKVSDKFYANYYEAKDNLRDAKDSIADTANKATGNQSTLDKVGEAITDAKDKVVDTLSSAYETTKEYITGEPKHS